MNLRAKIVFSIGLLGLLCLMLPGSLRADSFLTNPGFESGDFSGWTVSGNSPNFGVGSFALPITGTELGGFVDPHSGTYAGYAVVCDSGTCQPDSIHPFAHLELSQVISIVPGATYTTGFWVAAFNLTNQFYGDFTNIFVDGSPIVLSSFPVAVAPSYLFVGGTFTTTDPTPTITFQIDGSGSLDAGFSFDDFSVTGPSPVPEPATLSLLGTGLLGLLALAARTKRHAPPTSC